MLAPSLRCETGWWVVGSSFTEFRERGFWARDGLVELWLDALAECVPPDAPGWLREAGDHWREQARAGFMGCIDAGLDEFLTTPDRVTAALRLVEATRAQLERLDGDRGVPPEHLRQIGEAFEALLRGDLDTEAAASPVLPVPPSHAGANIA